MLRSTHKAIAEKIALELNFSEENTHIFVDGSTGPDTHGDFPHEKGKNRKILSKIDEARNLFLLNDEYSYGELANALHYIRDKWVPNQEAEGEATIMLDDEVFLQYVKQLAVPKEATEEYSKIVDILLTVKNAGIESWFNHSWGIWQRDYAGCVYVFADVVEMMLPTLQPDVSVTSDEQKLKDYVRTEAFKKATKDGFFASIITNFLYPKLAGYAAAVYSLASLSPPPDCRDHDADLAIAYRLSLELARYTLSSAERFKYRDSWTARMENKNGQRMPLAYVLQQYHVLIPKPVDEVQKERLMRFDFEERSFLSEWARVEEALPSLSFHSATWKILLVGLVELLKQKQSGI